MKQNRKAQFIALIALLIILVYSVLAFAYLGDATKCAWQFPLWFACLLDAHEGLAGSMIGAAVTLVAAWVAWSAVQLQIHAEQDRALAGRLEAERLLQEKLTAHAEGMAAAWRLLVAIPEGANQESTSATRNATAYMAEQLTKPDLIANYRAMIEILGWDRRIRYNSLVLELERLRPFSDEDVLEDTQAVLSVIRDVADQFEICLPNTSQYFHGLWRRSPKAMTFAMLIEWLGGLKT